MCNEFSTDDFYWMKQAFQQADIAATEGEVPVGAVLVSNGHLLGVGRNQLIGSHDPTAHAEILAIQNACRQLKNYRLPKDATLYVTLEPCTMCVGALIHARIHRVVFATPEPKAGALMSARKLLEDGYYNHKFEFQCGCMREECSLQLSNFFKMRREQKKLEKES